MKLTPLFLAAAAAHPCDDNQCDTSARNAQELRNTCPSGQDGMIKEFTHFSSQGSSKGCYQSDSYLYAVGGPHWGGGKCSWTSDKVQITHPHEFEQLYVKFQSADYGNLEATDYQQVELRTCKANNMKECSPWSQTVRVNDDVHGWTWTWINSDAKTATSYSFTESFAGKKGWTARNTPVKQDEGFVQARVMLKVKDTWHSERLLADNLQIWGDCSRDEAKGICHQDKNAKTTAYTCDSTKNWLNNQPGGYSQISMTDGCGTGNCAGNPIYGGANSNDKAKAYCKTECDNRNNCQGFFFQQHGNGHEICGFYSQPIDMSRAVGHGHKAGAVCVKSANVNAGKYCSCRTGYKCSGDGCKTCECDLIQGLCGAGITDHADDMFNQLTRAPTPAPSSDADMHDALHFDFDITVDQPVASNWEVLSGGKHCKMFSDPDGHCMTDNGMNRYGYKCVGGPQDDHWYPYWYSKPTGSMTTTSCNYWAGGRWTYTKFVDSMNMNENYGNDESCKFKYHGEGSTTLTVKQFEVERYWDWLKIDGIEYDNVLPSPLVVSEGTEFEFFADFMITRKGFKICEPSSKTVYLQKKAVQVGNTEQIDEQDALDSMPTASPTAFPTKIQADRDAINDSHALEWGWKIHRQSRTDPGMWMCASMNTYCYWYYGMTCINYCSSYNYIPGKKVKGRKAKVCKIQVTQDGECISDGAGDYGNNEHCKFSFTPQQGDESTFEVVSLDTEYHWDNIEFNGEQITPGYFNKNTMSINGLTVNKKSMFEFQTDGSVTSTGFKFCVKKPISKGSICTSKTAWSDGSTTKPVGWVGAGPGKNYCNIWKCNPTDGGKANRKFTKGTFKAQKKRCSIEEHGRDFCSHTSCTFSRVKTNSGKKTRVIRVHSDHREEVGGYHRCGFSKHAEARGKSRPACDCICHGKRRQDANGFARSLNEISKVFAVDQAMGGEGAKDFSEDNMYYWPTELLADFEFDGQTFHNHVNTEAGKTYARAHSELVYTPGEKYNMVVIRMQSGGWPWEMSWSGMGINKGYGSYGFGAKQSEHKMSPGTYTINMKDSWGDGWNGGKLTFSDKATGHVYGVAKLTRGRSGSARITISDTHSLREQGTFEIDTHDINSWADIALLIHGSCKLQTYRGNSAWHVVNNAGGQEGGFGQSTDICAIYTKNALVVPEKYSDCKVSLDIRDVDGGLDFSEDNWLTGKENNDFMCLQVLNKHQMPITTGCHVGDVNRRLLGDKASRHDIGQPWALWDGNDVYVKAGPEYLYRPSALHTIILETRRWGNEISWDINGDSSMSGSGYENNRYNGCSGWYAERGYCKKAYLIEENIPAGTHTLNMRDSYGDGWNGGSIQIVDSNGGSVLKRTTLRRGRTGTASFTVAREGWMNVQKYGITRNILDVLLTTQKKLTMATEWIPTNLLEGGFHVGIYARTNHKNEHWFADDLIVECREPLQRDERVVELAKQTVRKGHDATTDGNRWDAAHNSNNFYSQHDNHEEYSADHKLSNYMANKKANKKGRMSKDRTVTEYNENDHEYAGERVAHLHIDN